MPDASDIVALLGPTNTGKTHRAIERMLEHGTGMIGLPLRLLAREVYDKISARIGEAEVALVTGEEQRIPARPSYWVCTVEAMPTDREVDLVAIDEVQLAAHEQRGHVFTSRVLHARGRKETWLLGADTMRPVLTELVPTARQVEHPRLSRLSFAGTTPLSRVPPRSAVVAFSMNHVYEIAERIRARKGGAAVVLGALSPRTRNAQVAMFQAGEVDWLVATDSIGMGLNLDVEHVAFAALKKFDGHDVREVDEAELAQIAGRAGRWIQDGTFGAISPLELPASAAAAIEQHRFPPVRRVRWRNDDLAFGSVSDLLASLSERPRRKILAPAFDAEDKRALLILSQRSDVLTVARGEDMVRLLWDVCTIPDFRKLLFEAHAAFLAELYLELARRGRLDDDWVDAHVRPLDDDRGDVETLVARIAATRTWTYIANRSAWLESPRAWQERTASLEDRLSDALHEKLVARFVDVKKSKSSRSRPRVTASRSEPAIEESVAPGHPFAKLAAMRARVGGAPEPARSSHAPLWAEELVDADHGDFTLDPSGAIHTAGRLVGALARGSAVDLPDVRLADVGDLGAGARARVSRRLLAFARDVVNDLVGPARDLARGGSPSLRGFVHHLERGLGTARARDLAGLTLAADERHALEVAGVTFGGAVVWVTRGLAPDAIDARVALTSTFFGQRVDPPRRGAVSLVRARGVPPEAYAAIGFPVFGARAIRADVAERVASAEGEEPSTLASWIGCTARELPRALADLRRAPRPG